MTETARLRLPEIAAAQAQKHVTHNEALVALDTLVQISVLDRDLDTPPGSPAEGDCYIVASGGSGDWTGWDGRVARYEDGAWRSFLPGAGDGEGWLAYVQDEAAFYVLDGAGDWVALASVLGLGTAALADIGTSGATVPKLDANCTVSGAWTFKDTLDLYSEDDGSGGASLILRHNSATPVNGDLPSLIITRGENDASANIVYSVIRTAVADVTAGSESSRIEFQTRQSGTVAIRAYLQDGMVLQGATGGDQGLGTLNAVGVYDDGILLTCMALQDEFLQTGTIDPEANWDTKVPDIAIPEQVEEVPVFDEVVVERPVLVGEPDGSLVRKIERVTEQCARVELIPVYDAQGAGIDAVSRPVTERIVTPARTIPRRHEVAHLFRRMLDDGFDPRDPAQYVAKLRTDRALPGMPTEAEWSHNALSVGEMMSRKWLAMEILALVVCNHEERIAALEQAATG